MKVLILGATGILGQTMRLYVPEGVEAVYTSRKGDRLHRVLDPGDSYELLRFLKLEQPDVIVNLAGEARVDVVEKEDVTGTLFINAVLPTLLVRWCDEQDAFYVHVSTQAVFDGEYPPYGPWSGLTGIPVNKYGQQKREAELRVQAHSNWAIVRPTFVLGIRPMRHLGRRNPLEDALENDRQLQVWDRYFSPCFAREAAQTLWSVATSRRAYDQQIVHLGLPMTTTRYSIAVAARLAIDDDSRAITAVPNDSFAGIAPRPNDTTWAYGCRHGLQRGTEDDFQPAMNRCANEWRERMTFSIRERASEIAIFLGISEAVALAELEQGFSAMHVKVAEDYRSANPQTDLEILEWYRKTERYIWELSAYHADKGFNYTGMCHGIAMHLLNAGKPRVLCLADGIGDLSIALARAGLKPVYNDLASSKTAAFAQMRTSMHLPTEIEQLMTSYWRPLIGTDEFDAIVSLDFFEHLPNVEEWVRAVFEALRPGGLFLAQNAFAIGSGQDGSIPMHLTCNDRFEKDWDPLLEATGFVRAEGGWWTRP